MRIYGGIFDGMTMRDNMTMGQFLEENWPRHPQLRLSRSILRQQDTVFMWAWRECNGDTALSTHHPDRWRCLIGIGCPIHDTATSDTGPGQSSDGNQ